MGGLDLSIEWSKKSGRYNPSASKRPGKDKHDPKCRDCGRRGHSSRDCTRRRHRSRSRDYDRRRREPSRSESEPRSKSPIRPPKKSGEYGEKRDRKRSRSKENVEYLIIV